MRPTAYRRNTRGLRDRQAVERIRLLRWLDGARIHACGHELPDGPSWSASFGQQQGTTTCGYKRNRHHFGQGIIVCDSLIPMVSSLWSY